MATRWAKAAIGLEGERENRGAVELRLLFLTSSSTRATDAGALSVAVSVRGTDSDIDEEPLWVTWECRDDIEDGVGFGTSYSYASRELWDDALKIDICASITQFTSKGMLDCFVGTEASRANVAGDEVSLGFKRFVASITSTRSGGTGKLARDARWGFCNA